MAISHAQSLLLLLLVLPAALGVKFQKCTITGDDFINVKTVKISPDPVKRSSNASITITGYTSKKVPDGANVNFDLSIYLPVSTKRYSLCDVTACPVAPGPFVITLPNVLTDNEKKRAVSFAFYTQH
ncbi:unnamed protein product [Thlaspi arvense]|uniref:MD-2-related lipid-recognition domain-containing protein n=1 Tax=Thlaspi arvense TaxID=13288 RepID=A0AAU9S487_THLAR|nr:unnamed protein product [Thlaspi arvense]